MNALKVAFNSTVIAASFFMGFSPAHAEPDAAPLVIAQASADQQDTQSSSNAASGTQSEGASADSSSGASSSGASQSGKASQSASSQSKNAGPVYLLVPVDVANNEPNMKNGCWARIYDQENYLGDTLTLAGPTALPDMDTNGFFGLNWDDRVDSVELGPKATLTVFDNENFTDRVAQFKAGQRVADVSKRMGFFDEFGSVRLECQQG